MPYGDPDLTDPTVLVGVVLPAHADAMRDMAYVFGEEFARLGFDEARLMRLFRNPFYAGAHRAYRVLGEPVIREIAKECVRGWGRRGASAAPPTRQGA